MQSFSIKTTRQFELLDITDQVQDLVAKSGVQNGIVFVYAPHTTAGIICNENDENVKNDILKVLAAVKKQAKFFGGFDHDVEEGNAHGHIISSVVGNSRSFILEKEKLQLGTWQAIMFLETDGPRERQVWVQIINVK